jgi:hypothetical protein
MHLHMLLFLLASFPPSVAITAHWGRGPYCQSTRSSPAPNKHDELPTVPYLHPLCASRLVF